MKINFSTFNGLAGDQHLLLIAETDCGMTSYKTTEKEIKDIISSILINY